MNSEKQLLQKILSDIATEPESFNVSDDDYNSWKENFESLSEHEKVFQLLGVLSQYLLGGGRAGASVLATAVICTNRWCQEKDNEAFLNGM